MNKFVIFALFGIFSLALLGFNQDAYAIGGTINSSTCGPTFGGTWNGIDTCTIPNITVGPGDLLEIPAGVIVVVPSGVTLNINSLSLLDINSGGTLNVNGGTVNVNSDSTVDINSGGTLNVNSGGDVNADSEFIDVFGTLNVNVDGDLEVGGVFTVYSGGVLNINDFLYLNGATLNVNPGGTVNVNSSGELRNGGDGAGVVNIGGTVNVNSGGIVENSLGSTINVLSSGTLITLGDGVVNADEGSTLNVNDGGSFSGTLNLYPSSDSITLNAFITTDTLTITGGGEIFDGTLNINNGGTVNIMGNVEMNNGSINVNSGGVLNINDFLYLNGATLNVNPGGTVNVNSSGELRNGGDGAGVVNIGGTVNVNSGGIVENSLGSTINVLSSGTLITLGDGVVNADEGSTLNVNDGGSFSGTLNLYPSSDSITLNAFITTDTLTITGGGEIFDGTLNINNGGTVNIMGNVEMNNGSINVYSGGVLNINDFLYLNGATLNVNPGGTVNVNSSGELRNGGDGAGVVNIGGTVNVNSGGIVNNEFGSINQLCGGTYTGNLPTGNPINIISCPPATLSPSKDSYLRKILPNINEGANKKLFVTWLGSDRTLVAFDPAQISSAIAGNTLQSATLKLYIENNLNDWGNGRDIEARPLQKSWTEGNGYNENIVVPKLGTGSGVTWNCASDTNIKNTKTDCSSANKWNGGKFGAVASKVKITNGMTGWISFDVKSDIENGLSNNGWIIKKSDESKLGAILLASREASSNGPQLVLTFVP